MGRKVRVNHPACPAGEDRKKRLFVIRTPRGVWAHCWHCNKTYFTPADVSGLEALDAISPEAAPLDGEAYTDEQFAENSLNWWGTLAPPGPRTPPAIRQWAIRKKFSKHAATALRAYRSLLYLPIYATTHASDIVLAGYQSRYFGPEKWPGPKYLGERWYGIDAAPGLAVLGLTQQTPWCTEWREPRRQKRTVYIVEGFAEAAFLADRGCMAAPLYGSGFSTEKALALATNFPEKVTGATIWLDNDNEQIAQTVDEIKQKLSLLMPVIAIRDRAAPNDVTYDEMIEALHR